MNMSSADIFLGHCKIKKLNIFIDLKFYFTNHDSVWSVAFGSVKAKILGKRTGRDLFSDLPKRDEPHI